MIKPPQLNMPGVSQAALQLHSYKPSTDPAVMGELQEQPDHINANVTDFNRMMRSEAPDYATTMTQESVDEHMDKYGWDLILEEVARGSLPNKLALRYNTPIIKFRRWLDSRLEQIPSGPALLEEAMRLCAESMVVKSEMTLMQNVSDPTQAGMMKTFSKRIAEIAEKLAPDDWGAQKDGGGFGGGGSAIQINIHGAGQVGADGTTQVLIPGTEILAGSTPVPSEPVRIIEEKTHEEVIQRDSSGSLGSFA